MELYHNVFPMDDPAKQLSCYLLNQYKLVTFMEATWEHITVIQQKPKCKSHINGCNYFAKHSVKSIGTPETILFNHIYELFLTKVG